MQKYLNTTNYSVSWFNKTNESGELTVQPPFQRNPVWSERQQSALIDTILLEYPIPELYMQETTDPNGKQEHIIVDGQQRIRAVIDFLHGVFELNEESPHWPGMAFEDLSPEDKKKIYEYQFVVRILPAMPDTEIREIFQRINKNTTILNNQELRHSTYWGPFIKLMEEISDYEFWNDSGIFSANDRRRMLDVEFISEIAVAYLNGIQNKKTKLEDYYQIYETEFDQSEILKSIFVNVLGEINQLFEAISKTRWRKKSDFYSLFLCLARNSAKLPLSAEKRKIAGTLLVTFANQVDIATRAIPEGDVVLPPNVKTYAQNVERSASDLGPRTLRNTILCELMNPVFAEDVH
jgi:Protein of unknown function DUF262